MKLSRFLVTATALLPAAAVSAYHTLSDASLRALPDPSKDFDIKAGRLLAPILIPRVPGTPGSAAVLQHFVDFWAAELPEWKVELSNHTEITPLSQRKEIPFSNFIATRDPPWARPGEVGRLVLVAHYDSKVHPVGFIGATDSAAPCAMLMHTARAIDKALTKKWKKMEEARAKRAARRDEEGDGDDNDVERDTEDKGEEGDMWNKGVMVLLLDGEEAFQTWSDNDSLYGARALAKKWDETYHAAGSSRRTALSSIDLFVLLDLLGSENPSVPSYFRTTHWAYKAMSAAEGRLRALGVLKTGKRKESKRFLPEVHKTNSEFMWGGGIQDDHIPFLKKGVEVLHIIPTPFPRVWHEIDDNGENLHMDTVHDWAMITTAFVAEWLELEGYMSTKGKRDTVRTEL